MKIYAKLAISATVATMLLFPLCAEARTRDEKKDNSHDQILRASKGVFDLQQNRVSSIAFYNTNYGIFGLDIANNVGGGFWPRGSKNQYIFGGGIWFGALKVKAGETAPRKLAVISYSPGSGNSWLTPGRISEGDAIQNDLQTKNRLYFSTDFTPDGIPASPKDGPNWPIWDTQPNDTLKTNRYFGNYIDDINARNKETYPKGPAYISQEDIFSAFKDTDLSRYEGGKKNAAERGYPMRLQFEQTIYSWGFGDYKDFIFLKYLIVNTSTDTLRECFMAPAMDMDIAVAGNTTVGAGNDHTRFYQEDPSLNLAVQWSDGNAQEEGKGFGYIGFDFLESPAIYPTRVVTDTLPNGELVYQNIGTSPDSIGTIRRDKRSYTNAEQLGLYTFRNWTIDLDPNTDAARYEFMAANVKDGDNGAGDKRFLMATGPFNMRPNDTARVVVGLIMANAATSPGIKNFPTGTPEDIAELVRKDQFAQYVYDNNFKAPKPPDVPRISWEPINNGVIVHWDSTAELSYDELEGGLDFLGYRLYRARNKDVDSFDIDYATSKNRTPEGWKEIASWQLPYPFIKSDIRSGTDNNVLNPMIDLIRVLRHTKIVVKDTAGPTGKDVNTYDPYSLEVMRIGSGVTPQFFLGKDTTNFRVMNSKNRIATPFQSDTIRVVINEQSFDLTNEPWGKYFSAYNYNNLFETVLKGKIEINRSLASTALPNFNKMDSATYAKNIDILYELIRTGKAQVRFPEFEQREDVRNNVIVPYMKSITNNRTFVDIGDDDKNGTISQTNDIATTEKLVNGLDYYYRMLAYDEGDYRQPTPGKSTPSVIEINVVRATPLAARAGKDVEVTVTDSTADLLGGIYNFRFLVNDADRVRQLYANHDLEIEFQPITIATGFLATPPAVNGIYGSTVTLRDLTTGQLLADYQTFYEPIQCGTIIGAFSENAGVFAGCDTCPELPIGIDTSTLSANRPGTFTTNAICNAPNQFVSNALGFAFDYNFIQQGGIYRPFSATVTKGDVTPGVAQVSEKIELTQAVNGQYVTFNEGPAKYIVQFTAGDVENLRLKFGSPAQEKDFAVTYLNVKVIKDTKVTLQNGKIVGGTSEVTNTPLTVPTGKKFIDPRSIPLNSFNLAAYGWVDGDWDSTNTANNSPVARRKQSTQEGAQAIPVGTQGRYYLTAKSTDGINTIKFTHTFVASGATFGMDFANKLGRQASADNIFKPRLGGLMPTIDFESGDEVVFETFGGAAGLPKAGAKIHAKVSAETVLDQYSDDILNQVQVVPNPYYVTHEGQKSQYDAKVYFTKLPVQCTISIYTINGDLIRTIEHNESNFPAASRNYREGSDVWDLLSDNKQRSASQVLIAKIETPNGASSILKFSIITGGYRQVPE